MMSTWMRGLLAVYLAAIALLFVFPPWVIEANTATVRYTKPDAFRFIDDPPRYLAEREGAHIDFGRVLLTFGAISAVTALGGLLLTWPGKEPKARGVERQRAAPIRKPKPVEPISKPQHAGMTKNAARGWVAALIVAGIGFGLYFFAPIDGQDPYVLARAVGQGSGFIVFPAGFALIWWWARRFQAARATGPLMLWATMLGLVVLGVQMDPGVKPLGQVTGATDRWWEEAPPVDESKTGLDLSGLEPLDVPGLTPVGAAPLLDTSGLEPIRE